MSITALVTGALKSTDAVDKIVAWLTGTLGWQQLDQPATHDYVVFSTGSLGDRPMTIFRIVANHYDPLPTDGTNAIGVLDNVSVLGYRTWNTTTHSGTAEVDRVGPWWWMIPETTFSQYMLKYLPENGQMGFWNQVYDTTVMQTGNRNSSHFDGRSVVGWVNNNASGTSKHLSAFDFSNSDNYVVAINSNENIPNGDSPNLSRLVYDKSSGKKYIYFYRTNSAIGQIWYRFDPMSGSSGSFTSLADPPWGTQASNTYGFICWDGNDKLYVYPGSGNSFGSYFISSNTWTSLTGTFTPGTVSTVYGNNNGKSRAIYVTASLNLTQGSDMIYWIGPGSTGGNEGNNGWLRYNIGSNSWATSSFNANRTMTSLPASKAGIDGFLIYDPFKGISGTLYESFSSAGDTYVLSSIDASNLSGTWVATASVGFYPSNFNWVSSVGGDVLNIRQSAGALFLPQAGVNLQLIGVGSKDYFAVTANWNVGTGNTRISRMVFAGYPTQYFKRDKFTLSGSLSAGSNVNVWFNESVSGKLLPYDVIELTSISASLNPTRVADGYLTSSRGAGEYTIVIGLTGSNGVVVNQVKNSYVSGDIAGVDPYGWVIGNDCCMFLTHRGANGYMSDGCADYLKLQPKLQNRYSFVGNRGAALAGSLILYQDYPGGTSDVIGELPGVLVAPNGAVPGDNIVINGHTYYVFSPDPLMFVRDQRPWMIGPTDV